VRQYVGRQLVQMVVLLAAISVSVFAFVRVVGDPVAGFVREDASLAEIAEVRSRLGLDAPLPVQYAIWVSNAVRGDFGRSYFSGRRPAIEVVAERLPLSAQLAVLGVVISLAGIPLGMLAAIKRHSVVDNAVSVLVLSGQAVPGFFLALALLLVFALELRWFPVSGYETWQHAVLPAIALAILLMPLKMRLVRSRLTEILESEYLRTARAKGLRERTVLWIHAFRNVAITVVTVLGLEVTRLIEGAIAVETVFAWPGLGSLMVTSVARGDFPVIQAAVLVIAVLTMLLTFLTDIAVAAIDPRIRLR
jgi:peptide/nickel transport system permease protein